MPSEPRGHVSFFLGRSHLSPDGGGLSRPAVHRLAADGYASSNVATCRQMVEAFLAPPSTAWQRMATLGSGWLRLAADGYAWQPMATLGSRWLRFDPSGGFCCAIINLRHRLSKQPSEGFWA